MCVFDASAKVTHIKRRVSGREEAKERKRGGWVLVELRGWLGDVTANLPVFLV